MMDRKRLMNLVVGPLLFLLAYFLLPQSVFSEAPSRLAVGVVAWMAYWWVMAPVDYAVTAFLPIVVNALWPFVPMKEVIANYSSETILLLLGASIITVSWTITGVDRRIASKLLVLVGNDVRRQVVFWYLLSAGLSSVLPNGVVCATVTPIALSMLKFAGEGDIGTSRIGSKILLTIAYAAGAGGLASPLGGAMNLMTVDYIQGVTGHEYMYKDWVVAFAPVMALIVASNVLFMLRDVRKGDCLGGTRDFFRAEYSKFPRMSIEETLSIAFFVAATGLAFLRPLYKDLLPGFKPAYAFLTCAVASFVVARRDGGRLMEWKTVQTKIVWELIFVFAGGLAAGTLINSSGAAKAIGSLVASSGATGGIWLTLLFITIPLLLSDMTSNTATAAVIIPVVISVVQGLGKDPIPYIYMASIGVNLSYMLPTSIRAIPVGYGLSPKYMFSEGWKITFVLIILLTLQASWLVLHYW